MLLDDSFLAKLGVLIAKPVPVESNLLLLIRFSFKTLSFVTETFAINDSCFAVRHDDDFFLEMKLQ